MNRVAEIVEVKEAYRRGIYGSGIGVAIVDTGIVRHMDFVYGTDRIAGFCDILSGRQECYDDNGHGTHVAGIIGGTGCASKGKWMGMAPKCHIIMVKVLNKKGDGNIADVLSGMKWIIENKYKYNIRIMNISVGSGIERNTEGEQKLIEGVNEVWDRGIVIVAAAGNNGPTPYSIAAPGCSPKIITVGACDDYVSGQEKENYSGRGPTKSCIVKPEIVAPGSNIVSCSSRKDGYTVKSGTSMATPVVSGAIALLLEKYPAMSNKDVKMKLYESAIDIGLKKNQQGWGLLNVKRMLK